MDGSDFRHYLRNATSASHEHLDARVGELKSDADYRAFLRGLHAYRTSVEAFLADTDWPEPLGEWRPRAMGHLLAADLAALGEPAETGEPLQMSKDIESLVGLSYVLEGSALGARILVKQAVRLGYDGDHAASYLTEQAQDIGPWRSFVAMIGSLEGIDRGRAADAANRSFRHAAAQLDRARR